MVVPGGVGAVGVLWVAERGLAFRRTNTVDSVVTHNT
jgi:hypothetical protein